MNLKNKMCSVLCIMYYILCIMYLKIKSPTLRGFQRNVMEEVF